MSRAILLDPNEVRQLREEWFAAVDALWSRVRDWASRQGWTVGEESRQILEERLGAYEIHSLVLDTPRGRLTLEPIAYDVAGARGRVDFSVWPSRYRVMLLREGEDRWVVRTNSGINWPHPWGESTFLELANALLGLA